MKKYLDDTGLAYLWAKLKAYVTKENTRIPFGEVDSTSTATAFTATIPEITELENGVCVYLTNGVVTSASGWTLNINGLGAKPVYSTLASASRTTTIFNVAYTMLFVYNEDRVDGGCWDIFYGYDSNTNTIGYQLRTNSMSLPVSGATYRYRLVFTSADGTHYVPANTSSSTNATASRAVNQTPIDPFGDIRYYSYTTAVSSGSRIGATYLWEQYAITLGYSFNRTGSALTLTSWKPVYVKCSPQADGSAIMDADTPYVQTLPTTEDGKIYIYLGVAYNATNIEFVAHHPVYYYKDGAIRLWTNTPEVAVPTKTSDLTNDSGFITGYTETDPVFSTSPAYLITSGDVAHWNNASKIIIDGTQYPITNIMKTNASGVSGVAVSYDDGSADGNYMFFADGVGLNTVKTAIESSIPTATSDLTNDSGFITDYTETDPTVPSWAKASTKPTYTASEVGALSTGGGQITGDITLYVASGNSPAIIFQRGTLTDNYNDWKIYDKGGYLYFAQRGSGSSDFGDVGYIDTGGVLRSFTIPWGSVSGKPTFSTVATSGSYNDLSDKPTIPTNVSDLTNDSGYITASQVPKELPTVTTSDNGKVLRVVDGAWSAVSLPSASGVSF